MFKNIRQSYLPKITSKILPPLVLGLIGGLVGIFLFTKFQETPNARIKNFYNDEITTVVSPTTIKKMIDDKDTNYILVDLRSAAEYNTEHFVTAINIPAVSMNTGQLIAAFKALPKDKEIIVHCYSAYCTLGRQVGQTLAEHGIYVHELDIGWSELKYHWDLWNPGAKSIDGANYIVKGNPNSSPTPGSTKFSPCVQGQFGC